MKLSVHRRFQPPGELRERATHASRSVSLMLFQSMPAEHVWPPRSNYDLLILRSPQLLRPDLTFVRAWICTDQGIGIEEIW